ncbi:hypothetical protein LJ707_10985 [Mucilaginibacter sp. UR6-1]|uniref:cyclophilin-like fold protein n=1 Tax=Mucilaginibacter sp. UR6-1 TaxID=1435643 RepID=UPI001E516BB8|nr:cyclophilin-like fold protein [Mucilaginibacter sp. UR6-1]MCC8409457.1 hypothetical protein [Mucilaginibacter sp. UR6-1]
MKKIIPLLFFAFMLNSAFTSCSKNGDDMNTDTDTENSGTEPNVPAGRITITAGGQTYNATLANNATARAFLGRLPLTINMQDLNNNEKYFDFAESLPANASNPGTINNGDIMLYGSNTLVLFYKGFSTSYSYTRIGRVDNPSALQAALGTGNSTVTFAVNP